MTSEEAELDAQLDELVVQASTGNLPRVLYHYTSLAAAEQIIRSQQLWLTSHDCTNDPHEIKSVEEVIAEVARAWKGHYGVVGDVALDSCAEAWTLHHVTTGFNLALGCFSQARDKSSQWKSYADNGRGVCLGFSTAQLTGQVEGVAFHLSQVLYGEDPCIDRLARGFRDVLQAGARVTPSKNVATLVGLALIRLAAFLSTSAKHAEWREEEEWRLLGVWPKGDAPNWLERGTGVRYIAIPYSDQTLRPLDEIIIGPKADAAAAMKRLDEALHAAGYSDGQGGRPLPQITYAVSESAPGSEPLV
jgi:hypothetical protein